MKVGRTQGFHTPVQIPIDAPLTGKVRMRIVTVSGKSGSTAGTFSIMPRVGEVRVNTQACGMTDWSLSWDKVNGVFAEYVIYLVDPLRAEVQELGSCGADELAFAVPDDALEGVSRPYFSVAVRLADGTTGKRSVACTGSVSHGLKLSLADLPFVESFHQVPSRYFTVSLGKEQELEPRTVAGMPGSNTLLLVAREGAGSDYDEESCFSPKFADNIARVSLCNLDLSDIPAEETVYLKLDCLMKTVDDQESQAGYFRVLLDDVPLSALQNDQDKQHVQRREEWVYAIEGGGTHTVTVEFSGRSKHNALYIHSISIDRPKQEVDLQLLPIVSFDEGVPAEDGESQVLVKNMPPNQYEKVPVKVYVDGVWVTTKVVETLPPYGE